MTRINKAAPQPIIRRRPPPGGAVQPPLSEALAQVEPREATTSAEYDVGYGKPPKQYWFKPGQSGNPKGRPKGARGVNAIVREMLDEKTEVVIRGKRRKVRILKALMLKQLDNAGKGDRHAVTDLINRYQAAMAEEGRVGTVAETRASTSEEDDAIVAAFRRIIAAEAAAERGEKQ